jgi:2-polyprenyl-3-methyl-5-hydroxy-6-metoxy-1,4-benzoquinol methylase
MAYQDFLTAFAEVQGIDSVDSLLANHAQRYSFQINSRDRARDAIEKLEKLLQISWREQKILDVGCAYGAFTIELAKRGARSVGIELSDKWLKLATVNARNEVNVPFINCDAASRQARSLLEQYGPFDFVFVNDVFEHIYDTAGLLSNIRFMMKPGGTLYFKVPNGHATRHVLLEGHKGKFGISLLAPDYWSKFVKAPFHIYYRRWEYFNALFREYGFSEMALLNPNTDSELEVTKKKILRDINKIKQHLKLANFENSDQFKTIKIACQKYFDEVDEDMNSMSWNNLFFKYRVTFWEGIVHSPLK